MANFIEFPVFDGVSRDLRQWIAWLEDFFVRERFTGDEKMNLAQSLLEGEANAWFYSSRKRFALQSWEHLVVELLLWRFGYFDDGGVFSDLELFLFWNKYDRILRKRRKRMTTTSIPEKNLNLTASCETTDSTLATTSIQEAISESVLDGDASIEKDESYEATMVKVEDDTMMFQVSDSLEEESIHQNQVPLASVEPSLSFSCESLVVSDARQSEIVSNNWVHSQSVLECVKNKATAHHVFDELSHRRHKFQQRKKPSLSPKSRMFKFKNRTLLSNWSQMDLHQVIDISKVNNLNPCFSANFGLERKTRTFQCLRLKKQAHKSRVLYPMRMLHDPGGMKQLLRHKVTMISAKLPETIRGWDEACDAAIVAWEGTGTWIVTSLPANKTGYASRKGDLPENAVLHLLKMILELFLFIHLEDKVCLSGASNSWYGWLVFDRGKNHIITRDVITLVLLDNVEVGSKGLAYDGCVIFGMNGAGCGRFQTLAAQLSKHLEILINRIQPALYQFNCFIGSLWDNPITCSQFGHTTNMHLIVVCMLYSWGIYIWFTNFWERNFCKDWWFKFKYNIRIGEALRLWTIYFWIHNCSRCSCICCSGLYPFKLEDKLGLQGVSIDTFHHSHYRKNKKEKSQRVQMKGKTLLQREALPFWIIEARGTL